MTASTLVIAEVFGPTVQGEGPSTGRRAAFIRLGGCNLTCDWCDTKYTWDAYTHDLRAELTRTPVKDIVDRALHGRPGIVVITGGEPLLHQGQPGWDELLDRLTDAGVEIEIETNGTILPKAGTVRAVTRFNVSPKFASASDPLAKRIRPTVLAAFVRTGKAVFKIVCRDAHDVHAVADYVWGSGIDPDTVWIMPQGASREVLELSLEAVADPAVSAGFNLTTRLHVHAWGSERKR